MNKKNVVKYIQESFELKNQGFYKPAIEMLYKALTIESDNVEILSQLANLYFLLKNNKRAMHYVEKVLEIMPNNFDCLRLKKSIYLNEKNYKDAKSVCDKIIELHPTNDNIADKINLLSELKEYDEIKNYENSGSDYNDISLYAFAKAYFKMNDYENSKKILQKTLEKNSENYEAIKLLAIINYDENNFENSKKLFEDLRKKSPSADVYNYLGLFEIENNKIEKAISYFLKCYKECPQNSQYAFNLAHAYYLNGWFDEAIKFYNIAICLDNANEAYKYALAYLYYEKEEYQKCDDLFEGIKNINDAKILKAIVKAKNGDLVKAKKELENLLEENPDSEIVNNALGSIYKELQMMDKAIACFKLSLNINSKDVKVVCELVKCYIFQKKYDEANEILDKTLDENENYIDLYILKAQISYEIKDYKETYNWAQDIIELDENLWQGYYYNALALFEQKDEDFAIATLKKAIELDVNNAMLYTKMSEFYQTIGRYEDALDYIKEASDIDKSIDNQNLYQKLASMVRKSGKLPVEKI